MTCVKFSPILQSMPSPRPRASAATQSTGPTTGPGHSNPEEPQDIQSSFMGDQLPGNTPAGRDITPSSESREDGAKTCEQWDGSREEAVVHGPQTLPIILPHCTECQLISESNSSPGLGQSRIGTSPDLSSLMEPDDESNQEHQELSSEGLRPHLDQEGKPSGLYSDDKNHLSHPAAE